MIVNLSGTSNSSARKNLYQCYKFSFLAFSSLSVISLSMEDNHLCFTVTVNTGRCSRIEGDVLMDIHNLGQLPFINILTSLPLS